MAVRDRIAWDKVGACASAVCAVHCLLTGVALGLLSTVGLGFFGSLYTDLAFILTAVSVGAVALWHGVKKHHSYVPAAFYLTGIVLVVASHLSFFLGEGGHAETQPHSHGPLITVLAVAGGLCFVLFHVMNLRMQHTHERGECSCCQKRDVA